VDYESDYSVRDGKEAEELAAGRLIRKSYGYIRAEGSGEGNPALRAGMEIRVKGVGEAHSGTYIGETVTHSFDLVSGYITSFTAKRNMLEGVYGKGPGAGPGGGEAKGGGGAKGGGKAGGAGEESGAEDAEEEEEEQKTPEFTNLRWEKDGKKTGEALVDDEVTLCFDVKNINNGETVNVAVWEHDEDNEHDHVADLSGTVENGKVAITWKVAYTEDNDDSTSGKEMAEKGYTLPEYHFAAEYDGVESEPGPVLEVRGWVKYIVKKKETGEIMVNQKYTLFLPDQSKREGVTDGEGAIYERDLPAGNKYLFMKDEEEE
jgi:hypothetical protein